VADVFAFQNDGTVQAITADGTTAWTAQAPAWAGAMPDFQGGLVLFGGASVWRLDGMTGQASYTPPAPAGASGASCSGMGGWPAVHTDGSVFTAWIEHHGLVVNVEGDDPTTGARKFLIQVPANGDFDECMGGGIQGLIIAGDGYAYVPYVTRESNGMGVDVTETNRLKLLRVGSDGSYGNIEVYDWTQFWDDNIEFQMGGMILRRS
jgi:hypothetical protein